jgi:hypothetical protein
LLSFVDYLFMLASVFLNYFILIELECPNRGNWKLVCELFDKILCYWYGCWCFDYLSSAVILVLFIRYLGWSKVWVIARNLLSSVQGFFWIYCRTKWRYELWNMANSFGSSLIHIFLFPSILQNATKFRV